MPMIERQATRPRRRESSGASVASTITHELPGSFASGTVAPGAAGAFGFVSGSGGTGTPSTVSVPVKLLCTSTPIVTGPDAAPQFTIRDEVPIPALYPSAPVPVPAPTAPSATGPGSAPLRAASTCSPVTGRRRLSERDPSLVSATTGFTVSSFSFPRGGG